MLPEIIGCDYLKKVPEIMPIGVVYHARPINECSCYGPSQSVRRAKLFVAWRRGWQAILMPRTRLG